MSDEESGHAAPGRSVQDDSLSGAVLGEEPAQDGRGRRKGRRRTRRKGRKEAISAHQAGAASDTPVDHPVPARPSAKTEKSAGPSAEGERTAPQEEAKNRDGAELTFPRGGKRRRRRKGRGNGKRVSEATGDGGKPAEEPQPRSRRRRRRRAGRNGATVMPDAGASQALPNTGRKPAPMPGKGNSHLETPDLYAALDLGTNNCRLLVAAPHRPGRFKVVDAFSRIVRLGEGLGASGRLSEEAMDRALGALRSCAGKLQNRRIKTFRLIATEACRRASNGDAFLKRVENETGLKLEIVDRETEARLAVAGCSSLIDRQASGVVLFDIGGGSSELALLDLRKRRRHDFGPAMISWTSLPVGVVTLSERHGGGERVTRSVFEAMVDEVTAMLKGYEGHRALEEAALQGEIHLLGTSGTVTTLAGIHLELPRYDRRRVDGTWMSIKQVDRMIDELVEMSFEERIRNPCIGRDRADLVLAGCAILVAIRRLWPYPRLRVADRGLREGLLTEMMNADNAWRRPPKRPQTDRSAR